jgi:2'-5' RNA ligase
MSYTIGIGALIEGEAFNDVRSLELTAAAVTHNFAGLGQPPHITVKRPFTVPTEEDIKKVQQVVHELCKQTAAFNVQLAGFGHFGDTTLYLTPQPCPQLHDLHTQLLAKLQAVLSEEETAFEGKDMLFHVSIATSLRPGELQAAQQACTSVDGNPVIQTTIGTLGVFIGLDNNTHWSVLSEEKLQ